MKLPGLQNSLQNCSVGALKNSSEEVNKSSGYFRFRWEQCTPALSTYWHGSLLYPLTCLGINQGKYEKI